MAIFIPSSGYTSDPGFIPGSGYVKSSTVDSTSSTFIPGVGYSSGYGYIPGGGYAEKGALTPVSNTVIPQQTRISQPSSTPVFNPKLIPAALWLGSQSNRDLISGLYPTVVQDVTLNQPSYNGLGVYLNSAAQSTTRRLTLSSNASAVSIGDSDFTAFILFQSLGSAVINAYRLPGINRWNNAISPNTNEWILVIDSTTPKPTFMVEVGAVTYSAVATTPSLVNGEWYTLVGIRKGTTISVYCKRHSTGQIGFNSTTNAGITTVNNGKPLGTYLGEVKGAALYDNMHVPIAGTFKRALVESEIKLLLDNPWQIFEPDRRSIFLPASAPVSNTAIRVIPQQTRISQPQFPSKINWNNTITKGLVFAFNGGSGFVDLVSGNLLTITGTVSRSFSKYVGAYTSASTDVLSCTLSQQIPTTGGVSVLEIVDADAFDTLRKRSVRLSGATGTVLAREWFVNEDIATYQDSLGAFPTIRFPSYSAKTLYTNYIVHQTGDTHPTFYRNGQIATTTTNFGTGTRKEPITSIYIGNHTSAMPLMGRSYLVLVFNRVLTQAERQSIEANPWQIFEPDRQFNVFYQQVTQLSAYQSKIYRSGVWASVPVKRYDGVQWVNIAARPSV